MSMKRIETVLAAAFAVGASLAADVSIRPGLDVRCDAAFRAQPLGETMILVKNREYLLRYDREDGAMAGAFRFWVWLDGGWQPSAGVTANVETGRLYRLSAHWDGRMVALDVEGIGKAECRSRGRCAANPSARLVRGTPSIVDVTNISIRIAPQVVVELGDFRTRELLPRMGRPATLCGILSNIGEAVGPCTVTAMARGGAKVVPGAIALPELSAGNATSLTWTVDADAGGFATVDFTVESLGSAKNAAPLCRVSKRIAFMPAREPALTAKDWTPPIRETRAFYVDADAGDDAGDGLTPQTAWRTFANVKGRVLGPGERLLLKRGCVFRDELEVAAAGSADNWAEIGTYGEGGRPQIRRTRHLRERCVHVPRASHLAVRDLIVCNAGSGISVVGGAPARGHVLVERCLAHHIEGKYRANAHGIPEWRDVRTANCAEGLAVLNAHDVVLRDCEAYQCTSGFYVNGTDTFVNRVFCHDNYAPNTSPHPYDVASRSWLTDSVFDASGFQASAGTMGLMLAHNNGLVIRGCHFLNQPDTGSPDQGGVDFEAWEENCLIDRCTFRNNAGAAIEILGLHRPQARNVEIRGCRFDRNNWAHKNGPAEIAVHGRPNTSADVACSSGRIAGNGYVLLPGVSFYANETRATNDWVLADNRAFDFAEDLDAAFPYPEPPAVTACGEVWTDEPTAALSATVDDPKSVVRWEAVEGPPGVVFADAAVARTRATFPGEGDWRLSVTADNGTLWRAARTAVHVLPPGARTFGAWDFARNLDAQGWTAEATGTAYEFLPAKDPFWSTESFPVAHVCGDYYVIAVKGSAEAALVSPRDRHLGVTFSAARANALRIRMQNRTASRRMRVWWQTARQPTWDIARSVAFDVVPMDGDDRVYAVPMPAVGGVKQLKVAFADGEPVTGTVRLDYIWAGRLPLSGG